MRRPAKPTIASERAAIDDETRKRFCDLTIERAAALMASDFGAPPEMAIDRLATYAIVWMVGQGGRAHTAAFLRKVAASVERGELDGVALDAGAIRH